MKKQYMHIMFNLIVRTDIMRLSRKHTIEVVLNGVAGDDIDENCLPNELADNDPGVDSGVDGYAAMLD